MYFGKLVGHTQKTVWVSSKIVSGENESWEEYYDTVDLYIFETLTDSFG